MTQDNSEMAQVTFVLPGYPRRPSGGYKIVYDYANHLARSGHIVTVAQLVPSSSGPSPKLFRRWGVGVAYRVGRRLKPRWASIEPSVKVLNSRKQTPGLVPRSDIVIATAVHTAHFVYRLCQETGASPGYLIQGFEDFSASRDFVEATWRLPMRRVVVSAWLADIAKQLEVDVAVVPNAINVSIFDAGPLLSERPVSVTSMVSDQPLKRTDLVCAIFERLLERDPTIKLCAFGTDARPVKLPSGVEYHRRPSPKRLANLYKASRVYLCASDREGYGLPVAEAMASGCAVVSTRNGGVESFAGNLPYFAPAGDAVALMRQLDTALGCADEVEQRARAGRKLIASYTPEDAARSFAAAILVGDDLPKHVGEESRHR